MPTTMAMTSMVIGDHAHPPPPPPQPQPQGVPQYPQHVLYDKLPLAVAPALQQMWGRLQAQIDAHLTRTETLLMRAIQADIQTAIKRGQTPFSIPTLSPRPGQDPGSSGATQGAGPSGMTQEGHDVDPSV
ncbi:hypothetical protein Hanom_Chr08g00751651 [Helianthus anomalus]